MKIASVTGEKQAAVIDVPQPQAKENWVVVKIMSSPMCTEYKAFQHGHETHFLGHEAAGEVVEVAQPCRVKVGDRVVVMPQTPRSPCILHWQLQCRHRPASEAVVSVLFMIWNQRRRRCWTLLPGRLKRYLCQRLGQAQYRETPEVFMLCTLSMVF